MTFSYFIGTAVYSIPHLYEQDLKLSICQTKLRILAFIGCSMYIAAGNIGVKGSQMSLPSIASLIKLVAIMQGYVFQILFLGESISVFSLLGAVAILVGIFLQSVTFIRLSNRAQETCDQSNEQTNVREVARNQVKTVT